MKIEKIEITATEADLNAALVEAVKDVEAFITDIGNIICTEAFLGRLQRAGQVAGYSTRLDGVSFCLGDTETEHCVYSPKHTCLIMCSPGTPQAHERLRALQRYESAPEYTITALYPDNSTTSYKVRTHKLDNDRIKRENVGATAIEIAHNSHPKDSRIILATKTGRQQLAASAWHNVWTTEANWSVLSDGYIASNNDAADGWPYAKFVPYHQPLAKIAAQLPKKITVCLEVVK